MTERAPGRALVVVPTYNEADSIAQMVRRLFDGAPGSVDLLVVDDSSPDGTGALVRAMAGDLSRVHLLERPSKQGLASAYVAGFRWALERGYGAVVEMDADLSHDPADVPRLLQALDRADLVIGSRYVPGGGSRNWAALRRALSRGANVYAGVFLGLEIKDWTSGYRAFRTDWLATADLSTVRSEGYAFQIEMTRRVRRSGGRIVELPITFVERAAGRSKLSRRVVLEALFNVARWGVSDLLESIRRR